MVRVLLRSSGFGKYNMNEGSAVGKNSAIWLVAPGAAGLASGTCKLIGMSRVEKDSKHLRIGSPKGNWWLTT